MPGKYRKFTPEFREEAARMVVETSRPIADVARELGINEARSVTGCGPTVRACRRGAAADRMSGRGCASSSGRTRELKMENEFLKKAGVPRTLEVVC